MKSFSEHFTSLIPSILVVCGGLYQKTGFTGFLVIDLQAIKSGWSCQSCRKATFDTTSTALYPFVTSILLAWLLAEGCYSFQGISIPPEVKSYYVELFDNQASAAVPTLPRDFTERLKDKIRRESRLNYNDQNPDIEFSGAITEFRVSAEAPKAGERVGFNQLTIAVLVEFKNNKDEKANWKQNFSFFENFGADQNLLDVQERLIDNISKELVDRIFNKAFTNW